MIGKKDLIATLKRQNHWIENILPRVMPDPSNTEIESTEFVDRLLAYNRLASMRFNLEQALELIEGKQGRVS